MKTKSNLQKFAVGALLLSFSQAAKTKPDFALFDDVKNNSTEKLEDTNKVLKDPEVKKNKSDLDPIDSTVDDLNIENLESIVKENNDVVEDKD